MQSLSVAFARRSTCLLLGLVVSAIGQYGPMQSPMLGFPVDSPDALAVGVAAYYWAIATGFCTPEITELERQRC